VAFAIKQKLGSPHTTLDGTLVQAKASHKSVVPREVCSKPEEDKKRILSLDAGLELDQDPGNPTVTFRGERRSNPTPGSTTDPDATLAKKGNGKAVMGGDPVNGVQENRHRFLRGITVESFRGPSSETEGGRLLIDRCHRTHRQRIRTVGADNGDVAQAFLTTRLLIGQEYRQQFLNVRDSVSP
jgi:hypothetical protein